MALTLDDLNDDVLYVLLQWLFTMANPADPAHARMTRTGLASVNKHFRSLALPKLFRSVKLRLSVDGEGQHETTAWEHSELRALVRTLDLTVEAASDRLMKQLTVFRPFDQVRELCLPVTIDDDAVTITPWNRLVYCKNPVFPKVETLRTNLSGLRLGRQCPSLKELAVIKDDTNTFDDACAGFRNKRSKDLQALPELESLHLELWDDMNDELLDYLISDQCELRCLRLGHCNLPAKDVYRWLEELAELEELRIASPQSSAEDWHTYGNFTMSLLMAQRLAAQVAEACPKLKFVEMDSGLQVPDHVTVPDPEPSLLLIGRDCAGAVLSMEWWDVTELDAMLNDDSIVGLEFEDGLVAGEEITAFENDAFGQRVLAGMMI